MTANTAPRWNEVSYSTTCAACKANIHKGERVYFRPSEQVYYGNRCECGFAAQDEDETPASVLLHVSTDTKLTEAITAATWEQEHGGCSCRTCQLLREEN